jgi:hypothetical protein
MKEFPLGVFGNEDVFWFEFSFEHASSCAAAGELLTGIDNDFIAFLSNGGIVVFSKVLLSECWQREINHGAERRRVKLIVCP